MFDGRFVGFADFLIRDGEHCRVADTKLARSAKVTALLQLGPTRTRWRVRECRWLRRPSSNLATARCCATASAT